MSVDYATANGTSASPATAGSDYQVTSGTLTFAPGETSKTVTVLIHGDTTPEADEDFRLLLSNPVNATIFNGSASGVIQNDD